MPTTTEYGDALESGSIIELSSRVQAALIASGSLQHIGPLSPSTVLAAIEEKRCFVLKDGLKNVLGCAFVKTISEDFFPSTVTRTVGESILPWRYLHSIMLEPDLQGQGVGLKFFADAMHHLEPAGGTLFLDCWAGNDKLRDFYHRAGCNLLAVIPKDDYQVALFERALNNRECSRTNGIKCEHNDLASRSTTGPGN